MAENNLKLYQAPLQGYTDYTFRRTLSECLGGIDKYFIPYLSFGKGREIRNSHLKEVLPENNSGMNVVPQVLFSDPDELFDLTAVLTGYGYAEINLNLGCPYPMVTNRGRGAAWLANPAALDLLFQQLFDKGFPAKFSVKLRSGMNDTENNRAVFDVLNHFPFSEIIFHPRTASQMYSGKAERDVFISVRDTAKHSLVYNGDLYSEADFAEAESLFPDQDKWMIGRGLLQNPALAAQLKGRTFTSGEFYDKLQEFHDRLISAHASRLSGSSHLLAKMNQFWEYFCESFDNPHKVFKLVKKAGNLNKYHAAVAVIFKNYRRELRD